ncbi:MAG TPA: hypothetical protein VGU46_02270 [Acidobacteriaceae bacterium]|nr:hypothetical protein [Acidobacteriaceae bacterium]
MVAISDTDHYPVAIHRHFDLLNLTGVLALDFHACLGVRLGRMLVPSNEEGNKGDCRHARQGEWYRDSQASMQKPTPTALLKPAPIDFADGVVQVRGGVGNLPLPKELVEWIFIMWVHG